MDLRRTLPSGCMFNSRFFLAVYLMKRAKTLQRPLLPGRSPEVEFLSQVGSWYVNSRDAQLHKARIQKFEAKGLISLRRHKTTYGEVVHAYELTDTGLARLEEIAGPAPTKVARMKRQYLRDQARKNRLIAE
jgi:hypothetical protein